MVEKMVKKAFKRKNRKHAKELRRFEKMSVSDSEKEPISSSPAKTVRFEN